MRIRTIKPEFFTHDRLYEAESECKLPLRIAFAGLWCAADREGRFKWEPRRLGVQILPYDKLDFSRVLHALTTRGFVMKYATETGEFGWIPGFSRHQVVNNKERASELPEPILDKDSNACPTREPRDDHACHKEGKGKEHGKEGVSPPLADGAGAPARIQLPEGVTTEMEEAWNEWQDYRLERSKAKGPQKLAWTERAAKITAKQVSDYIESHGEWIIIDRINSAISGNWQGLNLEKLEAPKKTASYASAPLYSTNRPGSLFP